MFTRIAVVNRGEPATRFIRAVRELDDEHGYGIRVIAVHTQDERRARSVRAADEAVCLGRADSQEDPYRDLVELERALRSSGADAAWAGWGSAVDDLALADLCGRLRVAYIGPPAEILRRLRDGIEARHLAEETGVPVASWSGGPVRSLEDASRHAQEIGYPLVIRTRYGSAARDDPIVGSAHELAPALERIRADAARTASDPVVFLERCLGNGRRIDVQVIADNHGTVWAPGVRDCSIQRQGQTLIGESCSPALAPELTAGVRAAAVALVRAAGYRGAGTVGFHYQPLDNSFAFLEVACGLQADHPLTEATTGLDLVKLQLLVANGERLRGEGPPESGHAIGVRLNAEHAEHGSAPAPGAVELVRLPSGPGIRIDTGIATSDPLSPGYDSTVAKVTSWGRDRPEALARLRCALRETTIAVRDGTTTKSFLLGLLEHPDVVSGAADASWSDPVGAAVLSTPARHADAALLYAAMEAYDTEEARERDAFLSSARGGRPRASHEIGRTVELGYQGHTYRLGVAKTGPHRYRVEADGASVDAEVERFSRFESKLALGDHRFHVIAVAEPAHHLVEVDGISHRIVRDEAGVVRAPGPGVVVAVSATAGGDVEAGATVAVLETMKMATAVRAPYSGRVREVCVTVNSQVDAGAALLRLDRLLDEVRSPDAAMVSFDLPTSAVSDARARAREHLTGLNALVTGFDVSPARARTLVAEYGRVRRQLAPDDSELFQDEIGLLTTFADLCELSRNRPTTEEESADERVHSPREHFHSFLKSLDVEREGLPDAFRTRLSRALRHYGVEDLSPGVELEEAVYRVFLAQQWAAHQVPVIAALLERWLPDAEALTGRARDELGGVLDRLIVATQLRYPVIGDLARSIRFRAFDQPLILRAREQAHAEARKHLDHLTEHPDAPDFTERIEALVGSPEPLIRLLAQRISERSTGWEPMLEVVTRRYYKIRALEGVRSFRLDGRQFVTGEFELRGQQLHLISTVASFSQLAAALASVAKVARDVSEPANLVVDVYLAWSEPPADPDSMAETLRDVLLEVPVLRTGRRVTVTVCSQAGAEVQHVTFRPSQGTLAEERVIRGMHPLIGQRLDLWRLKNFDGTRLPSPEDTYLFHLVAPDNRADERLVALAEIRDLTPLRDAAGRVVAFPTVERVLAACLDGIRQAQAQRGPGRRLDGNRIFLYAWPPIELPVEKIASFAETTAPLTVGAGLEEVMMLARLQEQPGQEPRDVALRFTYRPGAGVDVTVVQPPTEPLAPLDEYTQKVKRSRSRGAVYPYELVPMLTRADGSFAELDLDPDGRLEPVDRPPGRNRAGIVVGLVATPTARYPEGMVRVALFGDPTMALGSVSEPECARIIAALDLAAEMRVPVEWFALSSGAKISMDSGTENMDWVSRTLHRLITFTQAGGEVNVVVAGINVGAQPYWNAEATMLLHTRGVLIMTPDSAMVLTGKQSLDYSGGVSAEDNFGIGGYDRVMGPNGQAQYWAPNLTAACDILFAHYEHTYVAPGERFPRRANSDDPPDRDVRSYPHVHPASDFTTVGDIFSAATNQERKKPFDIRTVMRAVADQDHAVLERWGAMADADTAVVFDAHLGGYPVTLLGIESRPVPRRGRVPADGPDQWTAGTLFPRSSKKTARAINATSGNRPLVVLANLSGFDGSPESLRNMQLEYGAEIGRAMVNFDGPIVFCVVSRYHGGAFVVFSGVLNDNMEVIAVEGSFASVIGGAPAAAVVLSREVTSRTSADPRIRELEAALAAADEVQQARLRVELADLRAQVRSEKLGEVADEFERVHNIQRALRVGSVHAIIPAHELRPRLIAAVERGLSRAATTPPGAPSP